MEGFFQAPKSFFLAEAQRGISPHRVENNASPAATAKGGNPSFRNNGFQRPPQKGS
jgi:hypothetical protein